MMHSLYYWTMLNVDWSKSRRCYMEKTTSLSKLNVDYECVMLVGNADRTHDRVRDTLTTTQVKIPPLASLMLLLQSNLVGNRELTMTLCSLGCYSSNLIDTVGGIESTHQRSSRRR
mmetsp:Transcript_16734/g.24815  ORF Transcript_16734/g.24815 Transcript_16734/m.24815 type:complete len:116 (-) Transcript_16734:179-526(-)